MGKKTCNQRVSLGRALGDADYFYLPVGRSPLGSGPVYPEGPQCPEGTAGGCVGETPQRKEEMSHVEGDASSGVAGA